ncbi:hypothetical protein [Marilutibacter maris]|nr:hypothetical protein [Lysobacter maris]
MSRILELQKLVAVEAKEIDAADSTSSFAGCNCSTTSNSGCGATEEFVAV